MTSCALTHFKKMVRVWKTRSLLFCLRYDPLIDFRRQNHVTFIFINSMSHDLLVQMAYNQSKATRNSIHLMNQSNRSISICLLFLFCLCVFISRSYENHSIVGLKVHCLVKWKKNCFVLKPILCLIKDHLKVEGFFSWIPLKFLCFLTKKKSQAKFP